MCGRCLDNRDYGYGSFGSFDGGGFVRRQPMPMEMINEIYKQPHVKSFLCPKECIECEREELGI